MLTIHGVPISVHTRKVILAAIEKGISYHNEPVIPFHPPAGWDELSPTGKIPVVTEDDLTLRDSSVICAYLEKTEPNPPLYPDGEGPRRCAVAGGVRRRHAVPRRCPWAAVSEDDSPEDPEPDDG